MLVGICEVAFSEQEILDVIADSAENNTLLKRDTVFAQLNFCLKSGIFKLVTSEEQKPQLQKSKDGKEHSSPGEFSCLCTETSNFEKFSVPRWQRSESK